MTNKIVDSKGTEILSGMLVKVKGSKITRKIQQGQTYGVVGVTPFADAQGLIQATRYDNGATAWSMWINPANCTVVMDHEGKLVA
jgi:hypothetical protein